jgi:hypothetical protein
MGEQHRDGMQSILRDDLVQPGADADARVDDYALFTLPGRDNPAVGVRGG